MCGVCVPAKVQFDIMSVCFCTCFYARVHNWCVGACVQYVEVCMHSLATRLSHLNTHLKHDS